MITEAYNPIVADVNTLDEQELFGEAFVEEMNQRFGAVALQNSVELNLNSVGVPSFNQNFAPKMDKADKFAKPIMAEQVELNDTTIADGYLDQMLSLKEMIASDKFEVQEREKARAEEAMRQERDERMMFDLIDENRIEKLTENKKQQRKHMFTYDDSI